MLSFDMAGVNFLRSIEGRPPARTIGAAGATGLRGANCAVPFLRFDAASLDCSQAAAIMAALAGEPRLIIRELP